MKYLIITYDDYFNIPYVQYYEKYLQQHGQAYDIVLWDRSGSCRKHPDHHLVFSEKARPGKLGKVLPLLRWRRFVLRVLKENQYDRLVVLTTLPGVLLCHTLTGKYRKKYWFDVRDFTYEQVLFYKRAVEKLTRNALVTSISSKAFRQFLPETEPMVLAHNITNDGCEVPHCTMDPGKKPVVIGFVGGIQYQDQNEMLLQSLKNRPEFRLAYIGKPKPDCDLPGFCRSQDIRNVEFSPAYRNEEKPRIYESIDLINSIYGNTSQITRLALPNKLYDCILFKKPILVSSDTYLADIVEQYRLGLALDLRTDDAAGKISAYLEQFDAAEFTEGCRAFLQKVQKESEEYRKMLDIFCSGKDFR